jgi:hypothetical protein
MHIALHGAALYNFNMSLVFFSICFISRRCLRVLTSLGKLSRRKYLAKAFSFLSSANNITLVHCTLALASTSSLLQILNLALPFVVSRYIGQKHEAIQSSDPTSCVKNCFISGFEVFICAGFLPIRYLPQTGYYIEYTEYLCCLLSLLYTVNVFQLAYLITANCEVFTPQAITLGYWKKHPTTQTCILSGQLMRPMGVTLSSRTKETTGRQ